MIEGQTESRPPSLWSRFIRLASAGSEFYDVGSTPVYSGKDINGRSFSSWKRGKDNAAVLVFCGTWCKPCQWEVPYWNELNRKYIKLGLNMFGISMDSAAVLPGYVASMYINYRMCVATSSMLWNFGVYPSGRIPVVAFMNHKRVMSHREVGYHQKDHYEEIIKSLF